MEPCESMPAPDVRYVRFPPRWHNVLVPSRPAAATAVGMSLYTASKPIPVALQNLLWALARVSGGRALPGARERWIPPIDVEAYRQLWRQWAQLVPRPIDGVAVYERLQTERTGLTLMLCAGPASALVRVRRDGADFARELAISKAAAQRGTSGFRVPASIGGGAVAGWHWVAYEAIASRPHLPRYRLDDHVLAEVTRLVESVVERPADTPAHWRGAHGDLVPWNLRRSGRATWLIDWEDACWAPPGTDRVYLTAVVAAIRPGRVRPLSLPVEFDEARERLLQIVTRRPIAESEQRLRARLTSVLGGAGG